MKHTLSVLMIAAAVAVPCSAQQAAWAPTTDPALIAKARAIHERVMTADTHVDINANQFRAEDSVNFAKGVPNRQVDLPKMEQGGLDAVFLAVYVGQGQLTPEGYDNAYRQAVAKFDAIKYLTEVLAPTRTGLALTAADARRIYASGRKVIFAGIENGFPIGTDITRVKEFYDRGGRYMSLSHNGNSQLSDSNTGEAQGFSYNNGLSPLGRDVIKEMNKWGMMIDFSHPSKGAMLEMIKLSKAPIMGSHSGARAVCAHSRNADDEQLRALKANGGVIQLVAFASYVKCDPRRDSLRTAELRALYRSFGFPDSLTSGRGGGRGGGGGGGGRGRGAADSAAGRAGAGAAAGAAAAAGGGRAGGGGGGGGGGGRGGGRGNAVLDSLVAALPEARRAEYTQQLNAITARYPALPRATVGDFADHIDHVKKLIGVDYIGISSDFDGGGGVDGWNSATETFNVTLELVRRGYSEAEIAKMWSGNLLRVLEKVEQVAKDIQAGKIKA